jgi:PKD repeat protein
VTTDSGGSASVLLTAPSAGTVLPDNQLIILVTPVTGNFANASSRSLVVGLTGAPNTTAPTPAFTVSPPNPQVRQVAAFDASLTRDEGVPCGDSCTYEWDFDDGAAGLGRQIAHVFTVGRIHTVTLRVVDAAGTVGSLRQIVSVSPVPAPVVTLTIAPNSPVAGQMATLTATGTPATGHSIQRFGWDFGDGASQATTTPTISHAYGVPGSYTATVTATDDLDQTGAASLHFIVTAGLTAGFTSSPLTPRVGDVVTFNASSSAAANGASIVRYGWNFGDMSPVVTTSSPTATHRFTTARTYVIQLVITDSQGRTAAASQELRVTE